MRTRDLDEAIEAVTKVYCPHTIQVGGPARNIDALLEVTHLTSQPLVELSYGAPVKIDAGNFPRLFLLMHCAREAGPHQPGQPKGRMAPWPNHDVFRWVRYPAVVRRCVCAEVCSTGCGQAGGTVR